MPKGVGKIRIRLPKTVTKGEVIEVKALISHPMETGLRKDKKTGKAIPAHFINDVSVYYGDELVTHSEWTISISTNPFMTTYIRADKAAPLRIVWKDNEGGVFEETVQITPQ
jgi:sulfur-oxidizing protein SoxZ